MKTKDVDMVKIQKRILDKFTPEIIVKKYEDVYENIL